MPEKYDAGRYTAAGEGSAPFYRSSSGRGLPRYPNPGGGAAMAARQNLTTLNMPQILAFIAQMRNRATPIPAGATLDNLQPGFYNCPNGIADEDGDGWGRARWAGSYAYVYASHPTPDDPPNGWYGTGIPLAVSAESTIPGITFDENARKPGFLSVYSADDIDPFLGAQSPDLRAGTEDASDLPVNRRNWRFVYEAADGSFVFIKVGTSSGTGDNAWHAHTEDFKDSSNSQLMAIHAQLAAVIENVDGVWKVRPEALPDVFGEDLQRAAENVATPGGVLRNAMITLWRWVFGNTAVSEDLVILDTDREDMLSPIVVNFPVDFDPATLDPNRKIGLIAKNKSTSAVFFQGPFRVDVGIPTIAELQAAGGDELSFIARSSENPAFIHRMRLSLQQDGVSFDLRGAGPPGQNNPYAWSIIFTRLTVPVLYSAVSDAAVPDSGGSAKRASSIRAVAAKIASVASGLIARAGWLTSAEVGALHDGILADSPDNDDLTSDETGGRRVFAAFQEDNENAIYSAAAAPAEARFTQYGSPIPLVGIAQSAGTFYLKAINGLQISHLEDAGNPPTSIQVQRYFPSDAAQGAAYYRVRIPSQLQLVGGLVDGLTARGGEGLARINWQRIASMIASLIPDANTVLSKALSYFSRGLLETHDAGAIEHRYGIVRAVRFTNRDNDPVEGDDVGGARWDSGGNPRGVYIPGISTARAVVVKLQNVGQGGEDYLNWLETDPSTGRRMVCKIAQLTQDSLGNPSLRYAYVPEYGAPVDLISEGLVVRPMNGDRLAVEIERSSGGVSRLQFTLRRAAADAENNHFVYINDIPTVGTAPSIDGDFEHIVHANYVAEMTFLWTQGHIRHDSMRAILADATLNNVGLGARIVGVGREVLEQQNPMKFKDARLAEAVEGDENKPVSLDAKGKMRVAPHPQSFGGRWTANLKIPANLGGQGAAHDYMVDLSRATLVVVGVNGQNPGQSPGPMYAMGIRSNPGDAWVNDAGNGFVVTDAGFEVNASSTGDVFAFEV